jgi:hypothetical protein
MPYRYSAPTQHNTTQHNYSTNREHPNYCRGKAAHFDALIPHIVIPKRIRITPPPPELMSAIKTARDLAAHRHICSILLPPTNSQLHAICSLSTLYLVSRYFLLLIYSYHDDAAISSALSYIPSASKSPNISIIET